MSYKYDPYRDTFEHIPDEQSIIVKQIELTQDNIERIADAVVYLIKRKQVQDKCSQADGKDGREGAER